MISSSTGFCAKDSGGGKLHKIESLYYMSFSLGIQVFFAASIIYFLISLDEILNMPPKILYFMNNTVARIMGVAKILHENARI